MLADGQAAIGGDQDRRAVHDRRHPGLGGDAPDAGIVGQRRYPDPWAAAERAARQRPSGQSVWSVAGGHGQHLVTGDLQR
jgi:hypothetical protein